MKVRIAYKTKDTPSDKKMVVNHSLTIRQAKHIIKKYVERDDITDVWVEYFEGWHWYRHRTYKENGVTTYEGKS